MTRSMQSRRPRRSRRQLTAAALVLLASVGWAHQVSAGDPVVELAIDPDTPPALEQQKVSVVFTTVTTANFDKHARSQLQTIADNVQDAVLVRLRVDLVAPAGRILGHYTAHLRLQPSKRTGYQRGDRADRGGGADRDRGLPKHPRRRRISRARSAGTAGWAVCGRASNLAVHVAIAAKSPSLLDRKAK